MEHKSNSFSAPARPQKGERFFLTPSCILGSFNPSIEPMIREIFELLGIQCNTPQSTDESQATCCSGILFHGDVMTMESTLLVVARLWHLAAQQGIDSFSTACVTSYGVHLECREVLAANPEIRKSVDDLLRETLGRRLVIPARILHSSDVFYTYRFLLAEKLKYRLVNKATGMPLRVVDHVGCHYSKLFPKHAVGGMEFCEVLTGPITAFGGETIDYPERNHCCGMGFRQCMMQPNRGYTMACVLKKMRSMAPFKPDLILTNCPGCNQFLDKEQWAIWKLTGEKYQIPVLNYAELTGLLLGFDPYQKVGIQCHSVPVEPLLDKIGIGYDDTFALSLDSGWKNEGDGNQIVSKKAGGAR